MLTFLDIVDSCISISNTFTTALLLFQHHHLFPAKTASIYFRTTQLLEVFTRLPGVSSEDVQQFVDPVLNASKINVAGGTVSCFPPAGKSSQLQRLFWSCKKYCINKTLSLTLYPSVTPLSP